MLDPETSIQHLASSSYLRPVKREFLLNITFLVAINLLIKPFYLFGIDRTVQNVVPPGEYGLYFALFNFTFVLQIINDLGVQHFNNRNIAQHRQLLSKYFPNILILKGLLAFAYLVVVLGLAILSGYSGACYPLLLVLSVNQILASLIFFLRSNISGLGLYRIDSVLSVLDRVVLIGIIGSVLLAPAWRAHFRIEWFALAQMAALSLTAMAAFGIVRRHAGALRFRWRPRFLGLILRQSYPYALVIFLMGLYTRIDAVMVERMLPNGAAEADLYASAYRLLDASNTVGFLFAGLLFPMFARLIGEGKPVGPLVQLSLKILWAGAVSLAAATIFFRTELMVLLYENGGKYSGNILGWLMASFVAVSGSYVYGTLLGASGNLRAMNAVALVGVLLNIGFNLWLIPAYGALGAASATCITQFVVWIAQVFLAGRLLRLASAPGLILRLLGFLATALLLDGILYFLAPGNWAFRYLAGIGVAMLAGFVFRLLDVRELRDLLRR